MKECSGIFLQVDETLNLFNNVYFIYAAHHYEEITNMHNEKLESIVVGNKA